jgi:hypothetical protein
MIFKQCFSLFVHVRVCGGRSQFEPTLLLFVWRVVCVVCRRHIGTALGANFWYLIHVLTYLLNSISLPGTYLSICMSMRMCPCVCEVFQCWTLCGRWSLMSSLQSRLIYVIYGACV